MENRILKLRHLGLALAAGTMLLATGTTAWAQRGRGGPAGPPPPAQQAAPYDLTGTWVSIVTEDWRWRMVTPPKGEYSSLPINQAARDFADNWDMDADARNGVECRPFGAGGIMRVPGRVQISWEDDETLRIDTDAGSQTRLFHFSDFDRATEPTWQGNAVAEWVMVGGGRGRPPTGGSLKVVTTGMELGYVRWNGVPYSEDAVVTEYFDNFVAFDQEWFTVTTVIDDPTYFNGSFIVSSDFRKEEDDAGWNPTTCMTEPMQVPTNPLG